MVLTIYVVFGLALFFAAIILNTDDMNIGCIVFPLLIVYSIVGGYIFSGKSSDDGCTRYSSFVNDC
jgi:hypothetical protein